MCFRSLKIIIAILFFAQMAFAQEETIEEEESVSGFAWGVKSGLSIGTQKWNGYDKSPLFRYHGLLFIESITNPKSAVYAQLGYHIRGSATNYGAFQDPLTGNWNRGFSTGFQFRNLALSAGVKQRYPFRGSTNYFYGFGVRGEYTLSTNLQKPNAVYSLYFPIEDKNTLRRFNGGLDLSGGFEFKLAKLVGGILQITYSQDLTRQYYQAPIPNIKDPYTGLNTTIPQQAIKNISFEISLGIRLLRKVVYVG